MGFSEDIAKESKKYGGGGGNSDYFAFEEGVNQMRILAQPKVIAYHFPAQGRPDVCIGVEEGCTHHKADDKKPTIRLCTYILDRNDDSKVKFAELPLSISYAINDLQKDTDYAFTDFPMEYDVKITHDPKNSDPKAKYRLVASPKFVPITKAESEAFEAAMAKMSPESYVLKRKDKQKGSTPQDLPAEEINPEEVSF